MRLEKTQKDGHSSGTTKRGFSVRNNGYTNQHGRRTHHPRQSTTPIDFVCVDGEGMTVNGEHEYVLFGVGENQIEDPSGLDYTDVFAFLYKHYKPNTAYVGFFLGYDFTQIFKSLPLDKAWMLLTKEGQALRKHRIPGKAPHPVQCGGWQFDIMAMKRLRIRPKRCECEYATCKCKHAPWMYICDVGSFFQSSFLTVIDPAEWAEGTEIVTPEEFATIKEGKEKRSVAKLDDDMRRYNILENTVLARVMRTVDAGFHEIGIHLPPSKWFGPGQAAQAWLKNEKVPTGEEITAAVPKWFLEAARMSYYGGWFELFMHGHIPGTTHEYDINSAYPSVIAKLPCLLHGTYSKGEGMPTVKDGDLCLVYGKVFSPNLTNNQHGGKTTHIGTMLHRNPDGSILRPIATEGWFWWDELKAAELCGLIKPLKSNATGQQQIMGWVKYEPCKCSPPMAAIKDLYQKRLAVGKKSPLGKSAKLVYNSAYGKFAQSVGEPIYGNPIYASRITSGCRTMILNAIATHPNGKADTAMIATDGVYFLTPHPTLPLSKELGEWDYATKTNLTLFKPGVYWDDEARERIVKNQKPKFKARGFNAADFAKGITEIDATFSRWKSKPPKDMEYGKGKWPAVKFVPSFAMTTALQALRRNRWELAGSVAEDPNEIEQNSDPRAKRYGEIDREIYDGRVIYRSRPKSALNQWAFIGDKGIGDNGIKSTPYEKRFGMDDSTSAEFRAQFGETPDGEILDIFFWILNQ